jgi:predicted NAD/FAD-dependent oxidoreductase
MKATNRFASLISLLNVIQHLAKPVLIAGAGISGVSCAIALRDAGVPFRIVNKGYRIGGRMASHPVRDSGTQFDGRVFDTGASYFTVSDPEFASVVSELERDGIVQPWTDTFHFADSEGIAGVKMGPMRYRAEMGIRSVVEYLARDLVIEEGEITELPTNERLALCMPTPQAARVFPKASELSTAVWEPVISVSLLFDQVYWAAFDGIFVNQDAQVTWIANDGARRGDFAPAIVVHMSPVLSAGHLVNAVEVIPVAIAAAKRIMGFDADPVWTHAHRWTFAKPLEGTTSGEPNFVLGEVSRAGDEFSDRPRVEAGWLSGRDLGRALADLA